MPKVVGIDESILKRATCQHCGAINEYMPKEVRTLWSGTDYGEGLDGAEGFNCANCGEHVITKRW